MKRIFTLLLVLIAAFSFKTSAQIITCTADFTYTFSAVNTVNFFPLQVGDSLSTSHKWNFGDGSPFSVIPAPTHTYNTSGSFTVTHVIKKVNPNGVQLCADTVHKVIFIQSACNLTASFIKDPVVTGLNRHYIQTTVPIDATDSVKWTFGDGTTLAGLQGNLSIQNPNHTFANAGVYNVCLRVKKNSNAGGTSPCVSEYCISDTVQNPTACNLQANFNWHPDSLNSLKIWFTNATIGLSSNDSIRWTFGDGTSSSDVNPYHIYQQPGNYTVCLRVQKRNANGGLTNCISEKCHVVTVQAVCNLVAYFTHQYDSLNNKKVYFQNQSQPSANTDSLFWNFGDGTFLSGVQGNPAVANPNHTYANGGFYVVCLKVKKQNAAGTPGCIKEYCKTIIIQQLCQLEVNFTWNADSANTRKIYFHNTSAPITATDSVFWDFGDGNTLAGIQGNAAVANPVHIYSVTGNYNVCLKVKRNNSPPGTASCIKDKCKVVSVLLPCNFTPSFTWKVDSVNRKKIIFTNTTIAPSLVATAVWNFGDGTTATSWNAVHEYAQPGKYYVCLTVKISNTCYRTKCDSVTVPHAMPPCKDLSKFTYIKSATNSQTYTFKPDFISNDVHYTWTFGDGTGSQQAISTHTFAPGTYTVCLTAWKGPNCASTTCKTITVTPQFNCNAVQVSYSYQKDPFVPNKVYFYAISNYPILDQIWTIKKVSPDSNFAVILHQNNPVYVFPDTGIYKVCLRAVTLGGCIKEYCNYIHITHMSSQCMLQAYPNPATTNVNVNVQLTAPQMIDVYIYNSQNVQVREKHQPGNIGNNVVTIPVGDLPAGQYTMKIITGNRVCYSKFQKI